MNNRLEQIKNIIMNAPKLSPRQILKTSNLDTAEFIDYLQSLKGMRKRQIYGIKTFDKYQESKNANRFGVMFNRLINPSSNHKPMATSKHAWYGVEIECLFPSESLECSSCEGHGTNEDGHECQDCEGTGYTHNYTSDTIDDIREYIREAKIQRVNVKTDGSIKETKDFCGVEFNVLCSGLDDFKNLKTLCAWLNSKGAKVNKSCGLHVHLDQRLASKSEVKLRYNNLSNCVKAMAQIVPESRKDNQYCRLRGSMTERYSAVNGTALKKYNTIEIRLHSSTTEYTKIKNWIDLLTLIQNAPKQVISGNVETIEDLFMALDVPERLIEYCLARRDKFMGKVESQETNDSLDGLPLAA